MRYAIVDADRQGVTGPLAIIVMSQQTQNICITCVHLYNICTMLAQRLRRWANIVQMLYKCFVFAGVALSEELFLPHIIHMPHNITTKQ